MIVKERFVKSVENAEAVFWWENEWFSAGAVDKSSEKSTVFHKLWGKGCGIVGESLLKNGRKSLTARHWLGVLKVVTTLEKSLID